MPAPTYWTEVHADGHPVYHCLYCAEQGTEHHSTDEALFLAHMEQRHDGRMVEDAEGAKKAQEDHPHGGPPGQTGEHPQGEPPGQTGEPPVDPNAPHVEHHEEGT